MGPPRVTRLLAFARELQRAASFEEVLLATQVELEQAVGYRHVWMFVADREDGDEMRLLDAVGGKRGEIWERAPVLKVRGDAMMEQILSSDEPVVVEDARTDPRTNKQIVAQLGNRTIVNVPFRLLDKPFGALGTGTFGDEGCRPPTRAELDYLVGMAGQLAVAVGRIRFLEDRRNAELALRRTEEQLRHAQKMEAVGRLAGAMAHDFNNLLSVVLGYTDVILADLPAEHAFFADLQEIRKAGERGAELTRRLLSFSRQQVVERQVLDVNRIALDMERMVRRLVKPDIEYRTLPADGLWPVLADRGQLEQVLMNLLMNACDAMPRGGRLTVETCNVELDAAYAREHIGVRPGPHVLIAVSDTGIGMDKATLSRIFEPFFTTKVPGKGTGLGLSTVYGIVEQSRGNVWVYSEPGRGTTFRVYLPKADSAEERPQAQAPAPRTLHGTETVLLVEDEEQVRALAHAVLERHGYRVRAASSAQEALANAERDPTPIHLLLTDVVLPQMGGPELAAQLTALRPELRVVFMSGYTEGMISHEHAFPSELTLLQKPFTPEALLRKVRETLDQPRARPAVLEPAD